MNWNDDQTNSTQLIFNYTDQYHNKNWATVILNINVFSTEPPKFSEQIPIIICNTCLSSKCWQNVPRVIDPDSSSFSISFEKNNPSWISIAKNRVKKIYY